MSRSTAAPDTDELHPATLGVVRDDADLAALQELVSRLEQSIGTRRLVGQAQGILMERHTLSAEQALRRLRVIGEHTGRGVHDIAQELILTRAEPSSPLGFVHPSRT